MVTLDIEVNGSNNAVAAYKVVKILVYQKAEISKLIKTPQTLHVKGSLLQWEEN